MLKRFIKYYKGHTRLFALDMFCVLLLAACDLTYPLITRKIIKDFIPNKEARIIIIFGAIMLAICGLKIILNYIIQYYGHVVGVGMQADMRRDVFSHLQKLPLKYFDNNKTGTIMSRIINDLFDVSELAHHGPEDIILSVILFLGSFIFMAKINIYLTLIVFAALPVFIIYAMSKRVKMAKAFTDTRVEVGEVNAVLENSITGIRVTKAFTNNKYEDEKFKSYNGRFVKARANAYKVMAEFSSSMSFIRDFTNFIVIIAGGFFVYYGKIDYADFAAFLIFVNVFMRPFNSLIAFIEQYQNGMTGFKRFCELMDISPENEAQNAVEIGKAEGKIDIQNVSFSYENGEAILKDLTIHIPKGRKIAFVGESGGGKTTICNIIPRFYEIESGVVKLDDIDIKSIKLDSLRKNIGIVSQDVFLFTGTILDNIIYGRPDATRDEVIKAAKLANIHEFIEGLPQGYETFVGERGVKLSGGQKQRIAIARVFLKNPPVLILDEATSALDNVTEFAIQESLELLCEGRTTIIVAHRLSTVRKADEIIVIGKEGIIERGNHSELLEIGNVYARLYNSQFEGLVN